MLKSIGTLDVKKGKAVGEHLIAEVRYKHKLAYFQYMRKRARWQELFQFIDSIVEKPINYDKKSINAGVSTLNLTEMKSDEKVNLEKLSLKPK